MRTWVLLAALMRAQKNDKEEDLTDRLNNLAELSEVEPAAMLELAADDDEEDASDLQRQRDDEDSEDSESSDEEEEDTNRLRGHKKSGDAHSQLEMPSFMSNLGSLGNIMGSLQGGALSGGQLAGSGKDMERLMNQA
ncbi:MAG: uncharacterized protein KVP18_003054 [Porospora cf. gigantea A]|uniref:uncharacterized protein n=2 Tax=Porospora cf. gigantea A TaxID=2853593 RepID=UPI00355A29AC|nr:MAG: hypothetical protein KVP18_003054 [Porospora cf. gigantea A]